MSIHATAAELQSWIDKGLIDAPKVQAPAAAPDPDEPKHALIEPAFFRDGSWLIFDIAVEVVSQANRREHWSRGTGRKGTQRKTIQRELALQARHLAPVIEHYHAGGIVHVLLVRIAPRELDPANLWSGMKVIEDAIAEWMGANDRPPLWLCEVDQIKSPLYGLRVQVWKG